MSRFVYTKAYFARPLHHLKNLEEGLHGHYCHVEISLARPFKSPIDEQIARMVIEPLDGKILNGLLKHPTGEEIISWVYQQLKELEWANQVVAVALQETRKNRFEIRSDAYLSDSIK